MGAPRPFRVLLVALGAVLFVMVTLAGSIYAYSFRSETGPAGAAIVLGAAVWSEQPSPVFRERINHAVTLYKQGRVRKIILTGGQGNGREIADAVIAKQYALEQAVPEADILIETRSRTTEQNLLYAYQVAAEHYLITFLIVSDPLHMKRAIFIARDLGMDAYPSPTPTSRYQSLDSQLKFLAQETYPFLWYLLRRPFAPKSCPA
jgi:uncharacterized SAM-binding protein YcdF (DUF218 family)